MDKKELLKEICNWYGYKVKEENGQYVIDNGCSDYSLEFVGKRAEIGHFEYQDINSALKDWVNTMEETNENIYATGDVDNKYNTWSREEIEFIKSI